MATRNLSKIYNDYRDEFFKSNKSGGLLMDDNQYIYNNYFKIT